MIILVEPRPRIFVDHAPGRQRPERDSGQKPLSLDESVFLTEADDQNSLDLDEALNKLAGFDARLTRRDLCTTAA